jgi:hypothetical protein
MEKMDKKNLPPSIFDRISIFLILFSNFLNIKDKFIKLY